MSVAYKIKWEWVSTAKCPEMFDGLEPKYLAIDVPEHCWLFSASISSDLNQYYELIYRMSAGKYVRKIRVYKCVVQDIEWEEIFPEPK